MVVADLSDSEVGEVIAAFPQLRPLDRHERPRQLLLRPPYLVDLLVPGSDQAGLPERMLAEEDLVRLVFERLIRRADGALPGQRARHPGPTSTRRWPTRSSPGTLCPAPASGGR
jgi:hypothetical protein